MQSCATRGPSLAKLAVVTGGARGIGLAIAEKFLAEGWNVALLDIDGGFDATGIGLPTLRRGK
jgi:NAD(P)-dependent dehydrogenase (short-subunit alcohol dehydrogenase family)